MTFPRRHLTLALTTVLLLVNGLAGTPMSGSQGKSDIFDANSIVKSLAPEILLNDDTHYRHVDLRSSPSSERQTSEWHPPTIDVAKLATIDNGTPVESIGTGITIDYATGIVVESSDFTVFSTENSDVAAYVQPTPFGVRLLTAIASADAPNDYSYTFDVPDGTTVRENGQGLALIGPYGDSLGQIFTPWAVDTAGTPITTRYEWSGKTLTQHIDLSEKQIEFPVLADPAWGYTLTYDMTSITVADVRVKMELNNCFDCYFPIEGAPHFFPGYNEFLPLTVSFFGLFPQNFNCYFDVKYYQNNGGGNAWYGFMFRAASGHIDGLGSSIEFAFNPAWQPATPNDKYAQLVVSAYIMNDPGIFRSHYVLGAHQSWSTFANNLNA